MGIIIIDNIPNLYTHNFNVWLLLSLIYVSIFFSLQSAGLRPGQARDSRRSPPGKNGRLRQQPRWGQLISCSHRWGVTRCFRYLWHNVLPQFKPEHKIWFWSWWKSYVEWLVSSCICTLTVVHWWGFVHMAILYSYKCLMKKRLALFSSFFANILAAHLLLNWCYDKSASPICFVSSSQWKLFFHHDRQIKRHTVNVWACCNSVWQLYQKETVDESFWRQQYDSWCLLQEPLLGARFKAYFKLIKTILNVFK